jgi:hypothetical protein
LLSIIEKIVHGFDLSISKIFNENLKSVYWIIWLYSKILLEATIRYKKYYYTECIYVEEYLSEYSLIQSVSFKKKMKISLTFSSKIPI